MSKVFEFYLRSAQELHTAYTQRTGAYLPFHNYVKEYFKKMPKAGSRDRKGISQPVYDVFRTGHLFETLTLEKQMCWATFLCQTEATPFNQFLVGKLNEELVPKLTVSLPEKISILKENNLTYQLHLHLPFASELSPQAQTEAFALSYFVKPKTFIRIRTGKELLVKEELGIKKIVYDEIMGFPHALSILGNPTLEELNTYHKGFFEIQDLSSQQVLNYAEIKPHQFWWDSCCASGGKSLLLIEKQRETRIFATDIRQSIIDNYKKRISKVGFGQHETQVLDLTQPSQLHYKFDGIICDVPCSGSGTWSRTPEKLSLYKENDSTNYTDKQRQIVTQAIKNLKNGGTLIYITCSVFAKENEEQVNWMCQTLSLNLIHQQLIQGQEKGADTMFVALLESK